MANYYSGSVQMTVHSQGVSTLYDLTDQEYADYNNISMRSEVMFSKYFLVCIICGLSVLICGILVLVRKNIKYLFGIIPIGIFYCICYIYFEYVGNKIKQDNITWKKNLTYPPVIKYK
jgi:hypothetical protein